MIGVIELGGQKEFTSGDTRGFDSSSDLLLIGIGSSSVNVLIAVLEGIFDSVLNLSWL
jgi:hypothetical protein